MPREWARQCRLNEAHAGPVSRSGLCPHCRRALRKAAGQMSGGKGGGRPRKTEYVIRPSWLPNVRREKRRRDAEDGAKMGVRQTVKGCKRWQGLEHRACFRCRRAFVCAPSSGRHVLPPSVTPRRSHNATRIQRETKKQSNANNQQQANTSQLQQANTSQIKPTQIKAQ